MDLPAPSILVIGEAAVEITPEKTVVPPPSGITLVASPPFRLPALSIDESDERALKGFLNRGTVSKLRVPGYQDAITLSEAADTLAPALQGQLRNGVFLPALENDRHARLLFAYRDQRGAVHALISDDDLQSWLDDLVTAVRESAQPDAVVDVARLDTRSSPRELTSGSNPPGPLVRFGAVRTRNEEFGRQLSTLQRMKRDLGVLILGETGTGKDHLARAIHAESRRARGPFVTINCAAIPKDLMESELFGHARGAFTGAAQRDGLVVSAHGGTLFLDEVGDAPMNVQLALLRLLDAGLVRPVGADRERPVSVRAIAATSAPLEEYMASGAFKRDPYYRLAATEVNLPPLRARLEDLPDICQDLLAAEGSEATLSPQALARLARHAWPGNIRELQSAFLRALSMSDDARALDEVLFSDLQAAPEGPPPIDFSPETLEHARRLWREEGIDWDARRYEARAQKRAALLHISLHHNRKAWPESVLHEWKLQFRPTWYSSENARGRRELMRRLGMDPKDEQLAEWLIAWLGSV